MMNPVQNQTRSRFRTILDRARIPIITRWLAPGLMTCCVVLAEPIPLIAKSDSGRSLEQSPVHLNGRQINAWQSDKQSAELTFKPDGAVTAPANGILYLEVAYVDQGYGNLMVQFMADGQKPIKPDRFLGLARSDSGKMVVARMRIAGIQTTGGTGCAVRIGLAQSSGEKLAIESVTLQETPFDDPDFKYVISDPWRGPYQGPSVKPPDNRTLKGKVMVGYQGWFRTPNDPDGRGWFHWGRIQDGNFSIDMWPDVSRYPASVLEKAAGVKLKSGKQAYLFSSAWPAVVDMHFRWMREHDIDGAFLQRFVNDNFHSMSGKPEWVLANVRAAANREGRIWAVEYDISGYPDSKLLETLKTDWKWFVDEFRVLEDPNYAREGGKPVVFIWGLPFPNRNITPETANAVVDFFRNDPKYGGNHVIGGIPGNWREMEVPWQEHVTKYDCVLAWMSQSFAEDIADLKKLGLGYYPHVKPGFSWANLKHLPTGDDSVEYTPRDGGRLYWNQLTKAAHAGADRLFVGMFDEYDEGTAIMPMSDDAPPTPVRPGVAATFYNGAHPQEGGDFRLLPSAELPLGESAPSPKTTANHFFVRMGGRVGFPVAGDYTFSIEAAPGDDVELFLNGMRILKANNLNEPAKAKESLTVKAGDSMAYRLECRHRNGKGTLRLMWEMPGTPPQAVPATALRDAWGRFITNEGKPNDWWLKLTRMGKEMITGKRKISDPLSGS